MHCRVCGREGYDICPECSFREQNQQCWRCRMYIPKSEMQQWRGQWICPNCRMDAEREEEHTAEKKKEEEGAGPGMYEKPGRCERCGRETKILYRFNNRNLCWYCLDDENTTDYSGAGPSGGAIRVQLRAERSKRRGIVHRLMRVLTGGKEEEEKETVVSTAEVVPIKKRGREGVPAKTAVPSKVPEKKAEHVPARKEGRGEKENAPVIRKEAPEKEGKGKKEKEQEEKKPDWSQWKRD
ncbi:MAG: hypothetical protein PHQ80_03535 [Candidatus ainarchaeum sp.]|nr:hypothetical protein [Candidatus ainarchaeum sp.]MDD5096383.1 hypothetical protein [Candidatus ainarchaeum sp.]